MLEISPVANLDSKNPLWMQQSCISQLDQVDAGLAIMLAMVTIYSSTRWRAVLELTVGCFLLREHRLLFAMLALYHWSTAWNRDLLNDPYRAKLKYPPVEIYVVERILYLVFFATIQPWFVLYPTILMAITVMQWAIVSIHPSPCDPEPIVSIHPSPHGPEPNKNRLQTATGHCLLTAMNIVETHLIQYYGDW